MNIKPTYQVFDIDGRAVTFNHPDHEWVKVVYAMVSAVPNTHRKIPVIKLVRTALDIDLKQAKYFVDDAWRRGRIDGSIELEVQI